MISLLLSSIKLIENLTCPKITFPLLVPRAIKFLLADFAALEINSSEVNSIFSDLIIFFEFRLMKSTVAESVKVYSIFWYSSIPMINGFLERSICCEFISSFSCPLAPNQRGSASQNTKIRIATTEMIVAIPPK